VKGKKMGARLTAQGWDLRTEGDKKKEDGKLRRFLEFGRGNAEVGNF
jgi:hypothetical protein